MLPTVSDLTAAKQTHARTEDNQAAVLGDSISVVIPAYNEEKYLPATLMAVIRAKQFLEAARDSKVEVIVVDNDSTDQTDQIACDHGALVIHELNHNIAKVRNTGARATSGGVLVFVDADTVVPEFLLWRIAQVMSDVASVGGAVDTDYRPVRLLVHAYLQMWRLLGQMARMAQGATQFYRRDAFFSLGGFDERLYVGEDVDLIWRLRRLARKEGQRVHLIRDLQVVPSCRRFDQWPLWRTLVWTNPLFIVLCQRCKAPWKGWYAHAPR